MIKKTILSFMLFVGFVSLFVLFCWFCENHFDIVANVISWFLIIGTLGTVLVFGWIYSYRLLYWKRSDWKRWEKIAHWY